MTDFVIVDTDVVSFLLKGDTRAQAYRSHLQDKVLGLSFMTVAELYRWAYVRQWGQARQAWLEERLRAYVIVPFDYDLCKCWADICVIRQRQGKPISVQDAWIAATARHYRCPLVTHNQNDFANIPDLIVISEQSTA